LYAIAVPADIKDILYSTIDSIGKEKIRMEVTAEIESSERYCNEILDKCKCNLDHCLDDESLAALCEALLHFMLTASVLPSERKVNWKGSQLDLVVPSLKMLSNSPEKSLVIQIIKRKAELHPHYEKIWIVSEKRLEVDHKNYYINSNKFPYSRIVLDINAFLLRKGDRGLKLLHG
jgi:intein/homing endonuclease